VPEICSCEPLWLADPELFSPFTKLSGPRGLLSEQLPQNQLFAITGSVMFTPAVSELSLISEVFTIGNSMAAVRNLWTEELACGRARKKGRNLVLEVRS